MPLYPEEQLVCSPIDYAPKQSPCCLTLTLTFLSQASSVWSVFVRIHLCAHSGLLSTLHCEQGQVSRALLTTEWLCERKHSPTLGNRLGTNRHMPDEVVIAIWFEGWFKINIKLLTQVVGTCPKKDSTWSNEPHIPHTMDMIEKGDPDAPIDTYWLHHSSEKD